MIGGTIGAPKRLINASGISPHAAGRILDETASPGAHSPFGGRGGGVSLEAAMGKVKGLKQRIAGKAKQAVGEIVGDQELHEDGKAEAERGRDEQDKPSELNPLKKLHQLT